MNPQGRGPLNRSHYSADSPRGSSYGSVRTAESEGHQAWARHPYYNSQETSLPSLEAGAAQAEVKSSRSKRDSGRKEHHHRTSKHGSAPNVSDAPAPPPPPEDVVPVVPEKETLLRQIDQNRDAMIARKKEIYRKRLERGKFGPSFRPSASNAPSLAAMVLVCIWISFVSGISILAFGWMVALFVQFTPFFYVSLASGFSLLMLGSFLAVSRSSSPTSVFGV